MTLAFARRHLADDLREHRLALHGDRGHLHRHVVAFERDIAVALAERRLGLQHAGVDQAFDHDLGIRRHVEIDGAAANHADRRAGRAAGHRHLVHVDRELLRPGEHHDRRAADHDGDRHLLSQRAIFQPVQIAAGAGRLARHHADHQAVARFERGTIGPHVADAAVGIFRHAQRGGEIRRGIEARRRDRHRQQLEAAVRRSQRVAFDHHLLARRVFHRDRRNGIADRAHPGVADLIDRQAHAFGVDFRRRRQRADHHRHVVALAFGVDDVGEQECAALLLRHAADELPAHQRIELGVLVDRPVDAHQQPGGFEVGEVLLKVEPGAAGCAGVGLGCGLVEHDGSADRITGAPDAPKASQIPWVSPVIYVASQQVIDFAR